MTQKAPEAFRTISEVASDLDLPQHVLRFWETRFSQIKPMKRGGGRRYYRPEDVDLLRGIRHLLYGEGYTIKGVKRILKERGVRFVMDAWQEDQGRGATAQTALQPPTAAMAQPPPRPAPAPAPAPIEQVAAEPAVQHPEPTPPRPHAPQPVAEPVAVAHPNGAAPVHPADPVTQVHTGQANAAEVTVPPILPSQPVPDVSVVAPQTHETSETELPQFGAVRQVSTGALPTPPPQTPVSAADLSLPPVPGPAVPAGPAIHPPTTAPSTPPATPVAETPVAPVAKPQSGVPAGQVGPLDGNGREKLQSALYELTECRRVLFDALRAGEE